jgi:hypothetical protein
MKTLIATAAVSACVLASGAVLLAQRPNSYVTPGAKTKVNEADVCAADLSGSAKPVAGWQRAEALKRYGRDASSYSGDLDHLIPVSLGGSNDPDNLWPMPDNKEYGIAAKRELEAKLYKMVCAKEITLKAAQDALKKDWTKSYDRYVKDVLNAGSK